MATVVELNEQELADLKAYTNQTDPAAAIRLAMTEYLRFARRMALKNLSGQVQMEENWMALEDAERKGNDGTSKSATGRMPAAEPRPSRRGGC